MNRRQIQFGMRENTASPGQHASRFPVHSGSTEFSRREEVLEDTQHAATKHAATGERRGENHLLTVQEVAGLLQVPVSWVYERVRKRSLERLPGYRLGKYWRFREAEVLTWIDRQQVVARSDA